MSIEITYTKSPATRRQPMEKLLVVRTAMQVWPDPQVADCCDVCNMADELHGCADGVCPVADRNADDTYSVVIPHIEGCDCEGHS